MDEFFVKAGYLVMGALISGGVGVGTSFYLDRVRANAQRKRLAIALCAEIDGFLASVDRQRLKERLWELHAQTFPRIDTPLHTSKYMVRPFPGISSEISLLPSPIPEQFVHFPTRFAEVLQKIDNVTDTYHILQEPGNGNESDFQNFHDAIVLCIAAIETFEIVAKEVIETIMVNVNISEKERSSTLRYYDLKNEPGT